jgi:hypothetical protein
MGHQGYPDEKIWSQRSEEQEQDGDYREAKGRQETEALSVLRWMNIPLLARVKAISRLLVPKSILIRMLSYLAVLAQNMQNRLP